MIPWIVFIFISFQLLVVAYIDFKTRKISNFWFLVNFLFFCLLTFIFPKLYLWQLSTLLFPLAFLVVGFSLFVMNIMGGGDSKYLSSFYLLVPSGFQERVFLYLLYTTVIVGSSMLLFNVLKNFDRIVVMVKLRDLSGIKKIFGQKFTYAPVIFIAWMWFGWKNSELLGF